MTTKEAILSKDELNGKRSLMARVDWRNVVEAYKEHYTPEQIKYLFEHHLLQEYVKTGASWERSYYDYWEFTDKGKRLRIWYNSSLWYLFKVYVIKWYWWKCKWQNFRIACGHRYAWQDYDNIDLDTL